MKIGIFIREYTYLHTPMKKIILSFIFVCSLVFGNHWTQALNLDLTITPIRNNFNVTLNQSTTGSVTLYNNSTESHSFIMSAEDCTTNTNDGTPLCNPVNSGTVSANSLASWIVFDTTGVFSIAPKSKRIISYTIKTPANAIPWGHYGAIFFNIPNNNSVNISMNRRIGSLLLVTVPGNIIVSPQFGNFLVTWGWGISQKEPDFIGDLFSPSQTGTIIEQVTGKWKKLLMMFADPILQWDIIDFINPMWDTPTLIPDTSFKTDFTFPVINKWTIHIIPQWQITLHEADGTQLRNIGKELITNEFGVFLREDVVDYLTINEWKSSVLPNTDRTFTMSWQWFAHETKLPDKTTIITYETPAEYYSRLAREEQSYIKPWEKLSITHVVKQLTAKIELNYVHPITKEKVTQNSEIPINIEYDGITKELNTGWLLIFIYLAIIIWIIKRRKWWNKKSWNTMVVPYMNDEIEALEMARNTITSKNKKTPVKKVTKKAITTKVSPEKSNKTISKATKKETQTTTVKPTPRVKKAQTTQEAPVKKAPVKKVATKKVSTTESSSTTKKTLPAPRKTPAKKEVIKTEI